MDIYDRFLDLSTIIPILKEQVCDFNKKRFVFKCTRWKEKLLSKEKKEVLVKAIISVIPTYAISCFHLLASLCNHINNIISNF